MNEVRISRPHVSGGRISAEITLESGDRRVLWFETDERFSRYLVHERSDAFVVGLIPLVATGSGRVVCEAPLSALLKHNLDNLLSGVMPFFSRKFAKLEVVSETDDTQLGGTHVGTGASCGIDSMATLATYSTPSTPRGLRIDTLTFFDVGSHGDKMGLTFEESKKREDLVVRRRENVKAFAAAVGLPLVTLSSNLSDFGAGFKHINIHTFRSMAAVLALGKMFSAYHYASTYRITDFRITTDDIAYADEFLLRCLSTESTRLYSSLASLTRQERTAIVADFPPARRHLNVCVTDGANCGHCFKCIRTMFQLDVIKKLPLFEGVFDISTYRRNPRKALRILGKDLHFHGEYLSAIRNHPDSLPFSSAKLRLAMLRGSLSLRLVALRKRLFGRRKGGR